MPRKGVPFRTYKPPTPFGPEDLMCADRIQIYTELLNIDVDLSERLHAVGMKENRLPRFTALSHNFAQFPESAEWFQLRCSRA